MIARFGRNFVTKNLVPGQRVYGERLMRKKGVEYRVWDPTRSKVAAALMNGMKIPFSEDMLVLYLGVASGTTASHLSDIITRGMIFGVDFAPRVLREFILLSETRKNLVPVFADANRPEMYRHLVPEVDMIVQDVAQPNQDQILLKNAQMFLKKGGLAFVAIKARSIDVTKKPKEIFREFKETVKDRFRIISEKRLEPFEKDHLALLLEFK